MEFMTSGEEVASVGGYGIEIVGWHHDDPELDILKIVALQDDEWHSEGVLFYRCEIDDLITVLGYWRDYYPGRGRNVRSEFRRPQA